MHKPDGRSNMHAGRSKGAAPKEVVLSGGHGSRRSLAKVTIAGRPRNAPRWSTAAALAMSGALDMCVEREGGERIAYTRALLCGRVPAGFFAEVRRLSSRRDEQRVRDIIESHKARLPEGVPPRSHLWTLVDTPKAHSNSGEGPKIRLKRW